MAMGSVGHVRLGATGMEVSELCLGAWMFGSQSADGTDIVDERTGVAEDLDDRLVAVLAAGEAAATAADVDAAMLDRVRSLGYVGGTVDPALDSGADAKDLIGFHNRYSELQVLMARGRGDEAAAASSPGSGPCGSRRSHRASASSSRRRQRLRWMRALLRRRPRAGDRGLVQTRTRARARRP